MLNWLYENREGTYGIDTGIRITIKTGDSAKDEDAYMDAMIENAKKIIGYKKKNGYKGYDMYYKDSSDLMTYPTPLTVFIIFTPKASSIFDLKKRT